MGISRTRITALWVFGAVFCATLGNSAATLASPASRPAPAPVIVAAPAPAPKPALPEAPAMQASDATAKKPAPKPVHEKLRRLRPSEVTVAITKEARRIIDANYTKPFGTEIPFQIGGKHYVGRIERHYHPPGGKLHPWGYHHGCSVFVVVAPAS